MTRRRLGEGSQLDKLLNQANSSFGIRPDDSEDRDNALRANANDQLINKSLNNLVKGLNRMPSIRKASHKRTPDSATFNIAIDNDACSNALFTAIKKISANRYIGSSKSKTQKPIDGGALHSYTFRLK